MFKQIKLILKKLVAQQLSASFPSGNLGKIDLSGWRHVCSVGAEVSTLSPNPPNQKGCEIVTLATAVLDHGGRGSLQPWKAIHHQTHNTSHVMCHRGPWPARNRSLSRVSISPNLGCQEMAFLEHPTTRNRSAVSPNIPHLLSIVI